MKYVSLAVLAILVLMSLAAGGAKLLQTDQEIQFFAAAGLAAWWMVPLGIVQIIGAFMATMPKFRRAGLYLVALAFLASAIMILMTGNVVFGLFAVIPAFLAVVISRQSLATG